jgi:hypothetical protein
LVRILCATNGLNEFFEAALSVVVEAFAATRSVLIDHHESTNRFGALYFQGSP